MVTVGQIIGLDIFSSFKLIAGEKGLNNKVIRGGIIDYESAEQLKTEDIRHEMLLSNLPMIKDQPDRIIDYIEALIYSETACFAIKTSLFKEIPEEAIQLANDHHYPIFLFDEVQLDKLVITIDGFVNETEQLAHKLKLIEHIQANKNNAYEVKKAVKGLSNYFMPYLMIYQLKPKNSALVATDLSLVQSVLGKKALILPLEEGYIVVYSSDNSVINRDALVQRLGLNMDGFYIGTSSITSDEGQMGHLIYESQVALEYAIYKRKSICKIDEIGLYQVLIPMLDNPISLRFYRSIIEKIVVYDGVHKSDLLKTAIAFIESDGQIKKTAERLYQHENTVRFRIRKLKEIIAYDDFIGCQYETLAMAIHLYQLSEFRAKNN